MVGLVFIVDTMVPEVNGDDDEETTTTFGAVIADAGFDDVGD